jgi:hypothetical protein
MANRRRRAILILVACGLVIGGALIVRRQFRKPKPISAELSKGGTADFLQAGLGGVNYSSDDMVQAFLRKWLPFGLSQKLPPLETVNASGNRSFNGAEQLVLLFRTAPGENSQFFGRTEFDESTGFTFKAHNYGSSGYGNKLVAFGIQSFPRRDRELNCRVYERDTDKLLFTLKLPNPAYKPDHPVWTPEALPATKTAAPVTVTMRGFQKQIDPNYISPDLEVTADSTWDKVTHYASLEDATGNTGGMLSPFESAWKVKVTVRRTQDATFTANELWTVDPLELPGTNEKPGFKKLDQTKSLDGISLKIGYLSSAGALREEAGQTTIKGASQPGSSGSSSSSGTNFSNGSNVNYFEFETGLPFFLVYQPQLPGDVELLTIVRDQDGNVLNDPHSYSTHGSSAGTFRPVTFTPRPESKTVQLTLIVNRSRSVQFLVAPPEELRQEVRARQSATMPPN